MLRLISIEGARTALDDFHPRINLLIEQELAWEETEQEMDYFTSEAGPSQLIACHWGSRITLVGETEHTNLALEDIVHTRFEPTGVFPGEKLKAYWLETQPRRALELRGFGEAWTKHLQQLPVEIQAEHREGDYRGAYFYWLEGEPRFTDWIEYPCRVVEGLELFELMKRSTTYDETGEYTKKCLLNGPSFVCEVNGEPVCWSCTHLNGMLGMIFTPEEFRRKRYARSLAAFHINYVLQHAGIATCFVMAWNVASRTMMAQFGAEHLPEPMVWRRIFLD